MRWQYQDTTITDIIALMTDSQDLLSRNSTNTRSLEWVTKVHHYHTDALALVLQKYSLSGEQLEARKLQSKRLTTRYARRSRVIKLPSSIMHQLRTLAVTTNDQLRLRTLRQSLINQVLERRGAFTIAAT